MISDVYMDDGDIVMVFGSGCCWGSGYLFDRVLFCAGTGYY